MRVLAWNAEDECDHLSQTEKRGKLQTWFIQRNAESAVFITDLLHKVDLADEQVQVVRADTKFMNLFWMAMW